jgi:GNAT superfamily N-acetyltransferase
LTVDLATLGLTLRPGEDGDSWDIIALIGACWSEYPGCVMDVHGECPDLLAPATAYDRHGGRLWVATDPCGTVVAMVGWVPGADPAPAGVSELQRLYVSARWRRRRVAAVLADVVETTAAEHGAADIELWSDTRFADAHRFYERRGYAPAGPDRQLGDLSHTVEHHYHKSLRRKALR